MSRRKAGTFVSEVPFVPLVLANAWIVTCSMDLSYHMVTGSEFQLIIIIVSEVPEFMLKFVLRKVIIPGRLPDENRSQNHT